MRAAIYARYSSENQRPESIEDQISACRKLASERGYVICNVPHCPDGGFQIVERDGIRCFSQGSVTRRLFVAHSTA
jgi:DNA invertase Pin-like site-specific DNA recombinase